MRLRWILTGLNEVLLIIIVHRLIIARLIIARLIVASVVLVRCNRSSIIVFISCFLVVTRIETEIISE